LVVPGRTNVEFAIQSNFAIGREPAKPLRPCGRGARGRVSISLDPGKQITGTVRRFHLPAR
jgi:hypothetical protein